ncbi:Nif3-like dinuclear metal center hexameric protein [Ligilactobacillus sp. WILCCON 0076]|uniref:GTP cyclohydrolase 1 type 2 homolog n=1 Tax=Ligilactobacillus ubinensis TaxID=2876789 RepID=A0A9X2FMT7_9LACO|nr:Nif3-like dinuclear metal center hexameric protein [Ligilactobacillus ubinensis]MCP0887965.1 Nif3-like dinuclear metal center hexameric protein [Ligilactobacillus ubinensis]
MKIESIISNIKAYHQGILWGKIIDPETTRDQILFGNTEQECTGIITTCWASIDVIKKTIKLGANLIICHEALFWNHGDYTDWLNRTQNETYLEKSKLLKESNIVIWRNHDYVHSGIPMQNGNYMDGIFYGFAKELKWENYIISDNDALIAFNLPKEVTTAEVANLLIRKFNLNGAKIIGSLDSKVKKIAVPNHILSDAKLQITKAEKDNYDLFLTLELIDFTLSEYIFDTSKLDRNKSIIAIGHFNMEEAGMRYMTTYILDAAKTKVPVKFIQSGDMYQYVAK